LARRLRRKTDGARILLVEDSEDLRLLMLMALEHEGYHVDSAHSAEEGLRLMEEHRYDLVLSDYLLPGRTGAWMLREALDRRLLGGAATLLVTATPDGPEIGPDQEVIAKPVDFDQFLPQIRAILGQAQHYPGDHPMAPPTLVELVLYVSPHSLACARAQRVMDDILRRYDGRQIDFRVCDTTTDPESAARDRIIFTPTLIKRSPPPNVWVLGDLTKADVVTDLLQMCGVSPVPATS
jgi:DNA-binding response OmpR family regulator